MISDKLIEKLSQAQASNRYTGLDVYYALDTLSQITRPDGTMPRITGASFLLQHCINNLLPLLDINSKGDGFVFRDESNFELRLMSSIENGLDEYYGKNKEQRRVKKFEELRNASAHNEQLEEALNVLEEALDAYICQHELMSVLTPADVDIVNGSLWGKGPSTFEGREA